MDIKLTCPGCGQHIVTDSSAGGQTIHCPSCTAPLVAPEIAVPPVPRTPLPAAKKGMSTGMILLLIFLGLGFLGLLLFIAVPAFVMGRAEAKKNLADYEARRLAISNNTSAPFPAAPPSVSTAPAKTKLEIKDIDTRYFKVDTDPITLYTAIRSKYNAVYRGSTCTLAIGSQPDKDPVLLLTAHYDREDFEMFSFSSMVFRVGDKVYTFKDKDFDNTISFVIDSGEDYTALQALLSCSQGLTVRFEGASERRDIQIKPEQIVAMKQVMWLWGKMQ